MVDSINKVKILISIVNFNCAEEIRDTIVSYNCQLTDSAIEYIVVDNYFDSEAVREIENIQKQFGFHLIKSVNNGYGYANNLAFKYAKDNQLFFDLYIVSNPDIQLVSVGNLYSYTNTNCIIAPEITTLNGVKQNPFLAKRSKFILWLWKKRHFGSSFAFWILASMFTKIFNRWARIHLKCQIYSPHGALIILTKEAGARLESLFENRIFLFCEEFVIAEKAYGAGIPIYFDSSIKITHKCHVSLGKLDNSRQQKLGKESYTIFYNDYYQK